MAYFCNVLEWSQRYFFHFISHGQQSPVSQKSNLTRPVSWEHVLYIIALQINDGYCLEFLTLKLLKVVTYFIEFSNYNFGADNSSNHGQRNGPKGAIKGQTQTTKRYKYEARRKSW